MGTTHLMMIGGAGFSTLSAIMLNHEGLKAMGDDAPTGGAGIKFIQYLGFGGILIGLSVFQIEFDFGVPQFRQVFQPMLIAAAAAFGLVAARISWVAARRSSPRFWPSFCAAVWRWWWVPSSEHRSTGSRSTSGLRSSSH